MSMQLEIAPQHHLFIIGRAGANVKQIMQHTGAAIHFPDPSGGLVNSALQTSSAPPPAQRKSSVIVSGPIDGVCLARQHLIVSTSIVIAVSVSFMCLRIRCCAFLVEELFSCSSCSEVVAYWLI